MRFRDLFWVAAIGLISWFLIQLPYSEWSEIQQATSDVNRIDAKRTSCVSLSSDSWVEFQIPSRAQAVRLLTNTAVTNPSAPEVSQADPRIGWRYSVDYQLLDSNRRLLDESVYHFRSRVQPLTNVETGETVYPMFFENGDVATQTRVMQISLKQWENEKPSIVRIRTAEMETGIQEVLARLLAQTERKDAEKRSTWTRLSKERRESISKNCVYDSDLLSDQERANLLKWQWKVAAAIGEPPTRSMYTIGDTQEQAIDERLLPAGRFATEEWLVSIPVPEGKGQLRLEFVDRNSNQPENLIADVSCFGTEPWDRSHQQYEVNNDLTLEVNGGLVQVTPNQTVIVRAFWKPLDGQVAGADQSRSIPDPILSGWITDNPPNEAGEFDITPETSKIRTYLADENAVEYNITHLEDAPTPFRLSLRQVFDGKFFERSISSERTIQELQWETLNEQGEIVDTGRIAVEPIVTRYDHQIINSKPSLVSDETCSYFSLPPNVARIRLTAPNNPILLSGAVRPNDLHRETRVPEDYYAFNRAIQKSRTWFTLRPADHQQLLLENRSFVIRSQALAGDVDEQILAGDYDWNRFVPKGNWIGREILVPMDQELVREEAIESVYHEVPCNTDCEVEPISGPHQVTFLVASDDAAGQLTVELDGRSLFRKTFHSSRGRFTLPIEYFQMGQKSSIRIRTENPTRVFLNGLSYNSPQFIKQTAQRIRGSLLNFAVSKKTDEKELITLRLFRKESELTRCRVRVRITPLYDLKRSSQPSSSWTVLDRVYDLRPSSDLRSTLVDARDKVDTGFRCFVSLNEDMQPGNYEISVECLDTADAYALLYQTTPGRSPIRKIRSQKLVRVMSELEPRVETKRATQSILTRPSPTATPVAETAETHSELAPAYDPVLRLDTEQPQTVIADIAPLPVPPSTDFVELKSLLVDTLRNADEDVFFAAPRQSGIKAFQNLLRETLDLPGPDQAITKRWLALGWRLDFEPGSGTFVLAELPRERMGRGVYAFRMKSQLPIAIQAPHRHFDKHTGKLALQLFVENEIRSVAFNSIHRKQIDFAHHSRNYFNAFMNVMAERESVFVQLHGFASENRSGAAQQADMIVSDTTNYPGRRATHTAIQLKESFGKEGIKLFPVEVRALGGTQNSQSSLLRSSGNDRFLHLEMDLDFRESLIKSASNRQLFMRALGHTK